MLPGEKRGEDIGKKINCHPISHGGFYATHNFITTTIMFSLSSYRYMYAGSGSMYTSSMEGVLKNVQKVISVQKNL
jgi:hypothetical protein